MIIILCFSLLIQLNRFKTIENKLPSTFLSNGLPGIESSNNYNYHNPKPTPNEF